MINTTADHQAQPQGIETPPSASQPGGQSRPANLSIRDNQVRQHRALIGYARFRLEDLQVGRENHNFGLSRSRSRAEVEKLAEHMKPSLKRMEHPIRIAILPSRLQNLEAIKANKDMSQERDTSLEIKLHDDDMAIDILSGGCRLLAIRDLCSRYREEFPFDKEGWWWSEVYDLGN